MNALHGQVFVQSHVPHRGELYKHKATQCIRSAASCVVSPEKLWAVLNY